MSLFPTRRHGFGNLPSNFGEDFLDSFFTANTNSIRTDIRELDDKYILDCELPGFSKDNISINYENNVLSISAQQESGKDETDEKTGRYIRRERSTSSFTRQFLVQNVDAENISATFENGVLSVDLPKQTPDQSKAKQIEIQ